MQYNKKNSNLFEVLEINQTKSINIFNAVQNLLKENHINFNNILSLMTDNAADMVGEQNGLVQRFI